MAARRCVYTVVLGGYERLVPQDVAAGHDVDLICFTDHAQRDATGWQTRRIDPVLPPDPNRSCRRPKILAHEYLDGYDESLAVDNTVGLTVDPDEIFDAWLPPDVGMAELAHSFRRSLAEKFAEVAMLGLEAPWVCDEQLAHYRAHLPQVLDTRPMWGSFLLRRHHRPDVRAAMTMWWQHVLRYSLGDQLSLPLVPLEAALAVTGHEVDNVGSGSHTWPRAADRLASGGAVFPAGPEVRLSDLQERLAQVSGLLRAPSPRAPRCGRAPMPRRSSWTGYGPSSTGYGPRRTACGPTGTPGQGAHPDPGHRLLAVTSPLRSAYPYLTRRRRRG